MYNKFSKPAGFFFLFGWVLFLVSWIMEVSGAATVSRTKEGLLLVLVGLVMGLHDRLKD